MQVTFWGVNGSIPTPLSNEEYSDRLHGVLEKSIQAGLTSSGEIPDFIKNLPGWLKRDYGGDTSCYSVQAGDTVLILDAGSGLRKLGDKLVKSAAGQNIEAYFLMSHTHQDHICGFPFFTPAYLSSSLINFYAVHPNIEDRFIKQQIPEFFPVGINDMASKKFYHQLTEGEEFKIKDFDINTVKLIHPGDSYSYRISHDGKTVVYATDGEHTDLPVETEKEILKHCENADLLIFDAQYTFVESTTNKRDWGHSNMLTGIDLAKRANVKTLVFTHHEPTYSDKYICQQFSKAKDYLALQYPDSNLKLILAYEGMILEV